MKRRHKANEENLRMLERAIANKDPGVKHFQLQSRSISDLYNDDDPRAEEKNWFLSFCNKNEVERIFNPISGADYLLKLRAEALFDSTRLERVILARKRLLGDKWSFSNHFRTKEFNKYIHFLPEEDREVIKEVPMGFLFTFEANGYCMKTEFGNIIVVSEALRHFFYYMNLGFLNFGEIPSDVRSSSRMIAIRTMLETEAMDFELDPRGKVPKNIHNQCTNIANKQIEFIFGHEIAHHLLNHLDENNTTQRPLTRGSLEQYGKRKNHVYYNYLQKQEFDADLTALDRPIFKSRMEYQYLVLAAILFFLYLDIFEAVSNYIYPPINSQKTHPKPLERFWNVYNSTKNGFDLFSEEQIMEFLNMTTEYKEYLIREHIPYNIDLYEMYGSIYLGQWRGKKLVDRVDY
ncbi:hypothetical protein [Paenibacillus chitinolyticus]|uniref:hypothetical protein n=1 Tax=Paenibacillus chitinolyticus TaxID=79263 RepID=UPI001C46C211|nr:hypothetical protein [Paenibacillus chitinolyticus]MBV6715878.1 hypothetical protein [Paenibacillus chitinolyticus]